MQGGATLLIEHQVKKSNAINLKISVIATPHPGAVESLRSMNRTTQAAFGTQTGYPDQAASGTFPGDTEP